MICPYCEFDNEDNSLYCGRCGKHLYSAPSEDYPSIEGRISLESQDEPFPGIFREQDPNYPPAAFYDTPQYHQTFKQRVSQNSRQKLTTILLIFTILLLVIVSTLLFSYLKNKRELASVDTPLNVPPKITENADETSVEENAMPSIDPEPTETPDSQTDVTIVQEEIKPSTRSGLVHIRTILENNSDLKFAGLGDTNYALFKDDKVWVYGADGVEQDYHDLKTHEYCDLLYDITVKFNPYSPPYDQQYVIPCGLSYMLVGRGQTDYIEHIGTSRLERIWFNRTGIYHQHVMGLYKNGELLASAGAIPRLSLSSTGDFIVSSEGDYIGTMFSEGYPGILKVWKPKGEEPLYALNDINYRPVFSFDGCEIASIDSRGLVNFWNCSTGNHIKSISFESPVTNIQYGYGNIFAATLSNNKIVVINPQTEQILTEIDTQDFVKVYISPKINTLVGVDQAGNYELYSIDFSSN
jgi:hypothetical protein